MPERPVQDVVQQVEDRPISSSLDENVRFIDEWIGVGKSWDIIAKPFAFAGVRMMTYVTNGFFLTMNMVLVLEDVHAQVKSFIEARHGQPYTLEDLVAHLNTHVAFVQVQTVPRMRDAVRFILSGPMIVFMDGFDQALMIDTRIYPMRSIDTPRVEHVIRGNYDSFTETMLMNTALIRRRLRDPRLRVELMQLGRRSQTDVSLVYLEDVADERLVAKVREKLQTVETDSLVFGEQQVTDLIGKVRWNPYPIVRYTERPDVAVTALLEGHVVIVVDTTAQVIIAPATFFQHLHHPQEYHSYPLVGTYMRWVILFSVIGSIFLPGVFLVVNAHPELMPRWMSFFIANRSDPLPLWVELVIAEVALDMLRIAVLNTPDAISSSVSIVAGLLLGQFAAKIHLVQEEVLVYMGVVMLAQYATSSYELGSANQMARLWVILWTAALGRWGLFIALLSWLVLLLSTRSFGVPYLWPLIPFRWRNGLRDILLRVPTSDLHGIPEVLRRARRCKD
ncbi:spore germination protein [Alicyclobacillus cellulosilyticus]|uniref:Spore germination protein n=1 Tax=Alicyclobacillus cellulosilyticus TaxID=1003997 RepID=A0A917K883_9BACL|nr:spore germination protein [Alicyclobacillus cellulosilyticus]GGJ04282.1 spore germination protein [Alicyclobacillus cellulosilyticus]